MFQLAPELQRDCIELVQWPLCSVLLMNDANYPWFILVPRREEVKEIIDLTERDLQQYVKESIELQHLLKNTFDPDKLNVAALGNMVPQLHIHHIVRYKNDKAWPAPVWGAFSAEPYTEQQLSSLKKQLALQE